VASGALNKSPPHLLANWRTSDRTRIEILCCFVNYFGLFNCVRYLFFYCFSILFIFLDLNAIGCVCQPAAGELL